MNPFPKALWAIGPFVITDSAFSMFVLSVILALAGFIAVRVPRSRHLLEMGYEALERTILQMTNADVGPLVPLVITLWLVLGFANLAGLIPGVASPTRDLSLAAALAAVSFFAGHVQALRARGIGYLRQYIEPSPFLLPFNLIGEISRTIALALRLFGNMLSGHLIVAITVYLAGLLLPVPLMLLGVLTGLVQAYIFGVLTLVFAASSIRENDAEATGKEAT